MTIIELKAAAYDVLAQIEALNRKLQQINQQIAELSTPSQAGKGDGA